MRWKTPRAWARASKDEKNEHTLVAHTMQKKIKGLRLEALADKSLAEDRAPVKAPTARFVLSEISVIATPLRVAAKGKAPQINVKLKAGQATAADPKFPLSAAIDNNPKTGWSPGSVVGKDQAASFDFEGDIGFEGGTVLTVTLKFEADGHAIGKPRLAIATTPGAVKLERPPPRHRTPSNF